MRPLTSDLTKTDRRPYFLWDEDTSIDEFRVRLQSPDSATRTHAMAKLLREARDTDVWQFVTPSEVALALPALAQQLGRRRGFWEYLIGRWRAHGLLT